MRLDSCSQAGSSLSRSSSSSSSNCDIDNYGGDQDHPNSLPTNLNETSEELCPSNVEKNTCESSNARDDSEVTSVGITSLEATDDAEQRLQPGAANEISSDQHSGSTRVDQEGGGVSLDRATPGLPDEDRQTESADHRHRANKAPLDFSGSRREEGPSGGLLQHTDDPGGSPSQNLGGLHPAVEVQQLGDELENEGVSLDRASNILSSEARQTGSADHRHQASEAPHNFSTARTEEASSSGFLQSTDNPGDSNAQNLRGHDSAVGMQQLHHEFENEEGHHETSGEPVEQVHATNEVSDERQFGSGWVQNQYENEDIGVSYLSELPEGNQDDNFQGAVRSWLEQPSDRDVVSSGRVSTFYAPDDENVYNMELQELLSR